MRPSRLTRHSTGSQILRASAEQVFEKLTSPDQDNGMLGQGQFEHALVNELGLNLSREEAGRLFLTQCDKVEKNTFDGHISVLYGGRAWWGIWSWRVY